MSKVDSYRELDVWIQPRLLAKMIYQLTKKFPEGERFGLTSQLGRAAISVPSNIAERCGRNHVKDSIQFYFVARGSLYEIETQLVLSQDIEMISSVEFQEIINKVTRCKKLLNGFINYFQGLSDHQPTTINEQLENYGNSITN